MRNRLYAAGMTLLRRAWRCAGFGGVCDVRSDVGSAWAFLAVAGLFGLAVAGPTPVGR